MYIYLVKYNDIPIAAAQDDKNANAVIRQYKRTNSEKIMKSELFEIEPIRFFTDKENVMELKIKKMRDNAILPTRGSKEAAGIDLYACLDEPIELKPHESIIIPSGIAFDFPKGYYGMVVVRSSIGIKRHIGLMNQVGIIDNDYKNEIFIGLYNFGDETQIIEPGERVCQLILQPYIVTEIKQVNTLSESERGLNGIGSTGRY